VARHAKNSVGHLCLDLGRGLKTGPRPTPSCHSALRTHQASHSRRRPHVRCSCAPCCRLILCKGSSRRPTLLRFLTIAISQRHSPSSSLPPHRSTPSSLRPLVAAIRGHAPVLLGWCSASRRRLPRSNVPPPASSPPRTPRCRQPPPATLRSHNHHREVHLCAALLYDPLTDVGDH
jgi:hypothetical protein